MPVNTNKEQCFILNLQELLYCLEQYKSQPDLMECVVRLYLERGYIDNLLYLEYKEHERRD